MPAGKKITVFNHDTGARYVLTVGHDGSVSKMAAWRCRDNLKTPPGYPGAGPLGEVGEQHPPETPGWAYTFEPAEGGGVKATPRAIEKRRRAR